MRVWLRGDDLELRLRPAPGEALLGEPVSMNACTQDRLLRSLLTEVPAHRVRALVQQTGERRSLASDAALLVAVRERVERGELVFVRRPQRRVDARVIVREELPPPVPFAPEGIIESNDWIEILVEDEDAQPVGGVAYELELPDGSIRRGRTNQYGIARCERIRSGSCKLTLVELDASAWSCAG